jgi:hypothetical protein
MPEQVIKELECANAQIQIVRRADGNFTFRKRIRLSGGWSEPGPDLGIYDSAETAEVEARERVWWLAATT